MVERDGPWLGFTKPGSHFYNAMPIVRGHFRTQNFVLSQVNKMGRPLILSVVNQAFIYLANILLM